MKETANKQKCSDVFVARDIRVILHDVRSAHNVGSAFRTCDAAGVSHLFLCGYTPTPLDRFGRPRADIGKVALGAEKILSWTHETSAVGLVKRLKKEGYTIIAVEQSQRAVDYKKIKLAKKSAGKSAKVAGKSAQKIAIIFGNEVAGVPQEILRRADLIAEIPMRGRKESLNVSVAIGVALFRMLDV